MLKFLAGRLWFYKIEGLACLNGINVYPKDDPNSRGFVLRIGVVHFKVRHSLRTKKWIVRFYVTPRVISQCKY